MGDEFAPSQDARPEELTKELAELRGRLAEIASMLRRLHGPESLEVRLTEDVSAAIQRLQSRLLGSPSAHFE